MTTHSIGIILNGVTGRMGTNQHYLRSILEIIRQGGVKVRDGETIMPDPILVGRNAAKLQELVRLAEGLRVRQTTDLEAALADSRNTIYFDAQTTGRRFEGVSRAIAAGKHIYCEKPTAVSCERAYELYELAKRAGVKHGVVQDKLWLPGFLKLRKLIDSGFFGEILSVRGEFGYWVFQGGVVDAQRPSWNYRKEDDGGVIIDMLCHWRYVLDNLFGSVRALSCLGATHIQHRWDEQGKPYACTADDSAYATFEIEGGIVAQFNSSWCVRVRRDDLLTLQVDGSKGSAVAGLRDCVAQHFSATPRITWNPDIDSPIRYSDGWTRVPNWQLFENAFKVQWELFLRHVVLGEPFPWDLREGAKGVQLAELGLRSWAERRWLDVPELPR
jgi:predicted dehydrogenase